MICRLSLCAMFAAVIGTVACQEGTTRKRDAGKGDGAAGTGGGGAGGGGTGGGGAGGADAQVPDRGSDRSPDAPLPDAGVDMAQDRAPDVGPDRPPREASQDVSPAVATMTCDKLAKARCAQLKTCAMFELERLYGDETRCVTVLTRLCVDDLTWPFTGDTPARVDACATATMNQTCADWSRGVALPACTVAEGRIERGAPCIASAQCDSRNCTIPANDLCGTCGEPLRNRVAGQACTNTNQCVAGLICPALAPRICQSPAKLDEACTDSLLCSAGLSCVGRGTGGLGVCRLLGAEGAACDTTRRTAPTCETRAGLFCKLDVADGGASDPDAGTDGGADAAPPPTTGRCAKLALADVGGACRVVPDGDNIVCRSGATCQRPMVDSSASTMGTCVARVAADQACNTQAQTGPMCEDGLRCLPMQGADASGSSCRRRDFAMCPL